MSDRNLFGSVADVKIYVIIIAVLLVLLSMAQVYFAPVGILLLGYLWYYNRRSSRSKEVVFNKYLDNVLRNVERTNHFAIRNLDIGMAVFSKDGKLQWKNELFQKWVGGKASEGKRPEELLPLGDNAFETMCVKDDQKIVQLKEGYYLMKYFSVVTQEEAGKNGKSGLMIFLTDVTELELLKRRYTGEKLCLAYVRFDNYEDVMKGLPETARANLEGAVAEVLSKWVDMYHGFACRANKENVLCGFTYDALQQMMDAKFDLLDQVRDIKLENKFAPTLSIGATVDGATLAELSLKAGKALELALGRGGDQAVVILDDQNQFFGGTTTVSAKSTRVRARIVAHTIHEQMNEADKVFVMGHINEDYDSIGSAIGVAKMAMSLHKETYIVISGESVALERMRAMAARDEEHDFSEDSSTYMAISVLEDEALPAITNKSLLMLVDHHREPLAASKKVLEAIPRNRIIVDHHRRAEDAITPTVLQYLEPSSSSTSELVTELLNYFDDDLELNSGEATALYSGLVVDTKNFAVQTGERTFEAAAFLRRSGADPTVVRQLFKDDLEAFRERYKLIATAKTPVPGVAIAVNRDVAKCGAASVIAAQAADTLINIEGIVVGVVINEFDDGSLGVSARSDGTVNVQLIMEELGGGGHQTVAGVQLENMRAKDVEPQIVALAQKQLQELEEKEKEAGREPVLITEK
jgi:c-di-AMP phosphodiesterase-like protein